MERKKFERLVEEALAKLPGRYRELLENVVILVEDYPKGQRPSEADEGEDLLMGEFVGVPRTEKSVFEQSPTRSEERRVGKECRSRWSPYH